jgi:5'-nucleotidase
MSREEKFTILIDMDETIAQTSKGLQEVFDVRTASTDPNIHLNITESAENRDDPEFKEGSPEEKVMREAFDAKGFFAKLEPMPGAIQAIKEMLRDGYNVCICTSPPRQVTYSIPEKVEWVKRYLEFPKEDVVYETDSKKVKTFLGKDMHRRMFICKDKEGVIGDILIDDKPQGKGKNVTWKQIWYNQSYNSKYAGPRITDWADWRSTVEPIIAQIRQERADLQAALESLGGEFKNSQYLKLRKVPKEPELNPVQVRVRSVSPETVTVTRGEASRTLTREGASKMRLSLLRPPSSGGFVSLTREEAARKRVIFPESEVPSEEPLPLERETSPERPAGRPVPTREAFPVRGTSPTGRPILTREVRVTSPTREVRATSPVVEAPIVRPVSAREVRAALVVEAPTGRPSGRLVSTREVPSVRGTSPTSEASTGRPSGRLVSTREVPVPTILGTSPTRGRLPSPQRPVGRLVTRTRSPTPTRAPSPQRGTSSGRPVGRPIPSTRATSPVREASSGRPVETTLVVEAPTGRPLPLARAVSPTRGAPIREVSVRGAPSEIATSSRGPPIREISTSRGVPTREIVTSSREVPSEIPSSRGVPTRGATPGRRPFVRENRSTTQNI